MSAPANSNHRTRLGAHIRQLREQAGISLQELADKAGILPSNLSRIEAGKYNTGQDLLSAIATALDKELTIQ